MAAGKPKMVVRVDFIEKVMVIQRLERHEELAMYITSKAEKTASAKVRGMSMLEMLKEQQRNKGSIVRRRAQKDDSDPGHAGIFRLL